MIAINKNSEPRSLTQHRATSHSDYDNYTGKDELRALLVAEQRGICCYCMGRIRPDAQHMKIEHWHCQDRYSDLQLDYANLLGACQGGKGMPRKKQYCDTRKGNTDLKWNPSDSAHVIESRIRYLSDGTIESLDAEFDTQLNDVLNLNLALFKSNRKAVLDGIIQWWKKEKARLKGPVPIAKFKRALTSQQNGVELLQYSGVAISWLTTRIGRMA